MGKSIWRWTALAAAGAALATGASAALIGKGKQIPAWTGRTIDGKQLASSSLKGKVVLINFFSFTCGPCKEEYPHLQELQKKYESRGFTVVSISADEKLSEASAFAKEVKATFPVVHDPKGTVTDSFHVGGIPANVIVDRKGTVVASVEGADIPAVEKAINKALTVR